MCHTGCFLMFHFHLSKTQMVTHATCFSYHTDIDPFSQFFGGKLKVLTVTKAVNQMLTVNLNVRFPTTVWKSTIHISLSARSLTLNISQDGLTVSTVHLECICTKIVCICVLSNNKFNFFYSFTDTEKP